MKMKMNKSATRWAATAAAVALAVSVPQAAQAGAKAFANLSLTNFVFLDLTQDPTGGSALELGPDVTLPAFLDTGSNVAIRASGPGAGADISGAFDNDASDGVFVDAALACVGPDCGGVAENDFAMGDFNTGEYTRADQVFNGSGLDISAPNGLPQGTFVDTSSANMIAEAITQSGALDQTNTAITQGGSFTITPVIDIVIGLDFDAITELWLGLHPDAAIGSIVTAGTNFDLSVTRQDNGVQEVILGNINDLDTGAALALPGSIFSTGPVGHSISLTTANALLQGITYDIALEFNTRVTLNANKEVPEPGPLALMGLGLLGFAFRFKQKTN